MANINIGTADGATIGNPTSGNYYIFNDSNNGDKLTKRNSSGTDFILEDLASSNRVVVQTAADFGASIDSTKEYFLDGVIDMTGVSLEVPAGGIYLTGYNFDLSGLTCSDASYTMFTSPAGGSGNVIMSDLFLTVDGASSQLFDLTSNTGFEAFEFNSVNFINCESLGEITNYRQWFEQGTGRFGGKPSLTCSGAMNGIFFRDTILRITEASWSGYLFEEGTSLTFSGRFTSNANVDFGANSGFSSFRGSNFTNPSGFQLNNCLISRNGSFDPMDTNLIPNIDSTDLQAFWKDNTGLENTYVGGTITLSTEVETVISTSSTFVDVLGTFTGSDLQHFSTPATNQLRHDGNSPRDFQVIVYAIIEGGANDEIALKVVKFDNSAASDVDVVTQTRSIINVVGGNDVAIYQINAFVSLDINDYVRLQVANNTDTTNVTLLTDSYLIVKER